ncbi:MAG: TMEM165/GDT1 family protein [Betaproteobacteria bacterium]|nr:TMEM165/GDT1 family protein [Betaproteobacteria bacterium]MBI2961789.1 TMEM165/GDT1 family protein [Betaproteobacteria bacterium]
MEAFLVSTLAVAVGEIGDKTQLLALVLAARFRRPVPIALGILFATLANHTLAALAGEWIRAALGPDQLRWAIGVSFLAVALWALKPDKMEKEPATAGRLGVFMVTLVAFFLVEIGDKTQVATVVLAARFNELAAVVAGTTLGMLIANVPVVYLGGAAAPRIPFRFVRGVAAAIFAALGLASLLGFEIL